jgi:uncharacterized protein (TIGR02996 family)
MHPAELCFIEAIHENPRDDSIRLIFADWLEERGDPYGEFIRLQCLSNVVISTATGKPTVSPDNDKGHRLLELFPTIIAAERFAFWHQYKSAFDRKFMRGLCRLEVPQYEAKSFAPPPLARLSLFGCGLDLKELLHHTIMARVDHISLSLPRRFDPWDGYEKMLYALTIWPGLKNLEGVTMCGGPREAADRLSQKVPVRWVG